LLGERGDDLNTCLSIRRRSPAVQDRGALQAHVRL